MNAVEARVKLWFCCRALKKGGKWETFLIESSISRQNHFSILPHETQCNCSDCRFHPSKRLVNMLLLYALLIKQSANAITLPRHLFVVVFFTQAEAASLLLRWPRSFASAWHITLITSSSNSGPTSRPLFASSPTLMDELAASVGEESLLCVCSIKRQATLLPDQQPNNSRAETLLFARTVTEEAFVKWKCQ